MSIPSLDDLQPRRRSLPTGTARDVAALALATVGVGGLMRTAFAVHPLLGAAVTSGLALAAGVALGQER